MTRKELKAQIEAYEGFNVQEKKERETILSYMNRFDDLLERSNEMAHFTASSLILNAERNKTLLIYHNLYDSWGWTGGHADGDTDLLAVALKEANEETGVNAAPISREILALDILPVWGHVRRGRYVSSHVHLNLTYLLEADERETLRVKPDENSGVQWFELDRMPEVSREPEMKPVYRKLIERSRLLLGRQQEK